MQITSAIGLEELRERYASIRASGSYADSLKEFQSWGKTELQPWAQANDGFAVGLVGGKPSDFGIQAMQFLPPGADPLASGMCPDTVMRAYAVGAGIGSQSGGMETLWKTAPGKFKNVGAQVTDSFLTNKNVEVNVRGGESCPEEITNWRIAAKPFLSSFYSDHKTEYKQTADELGISLDWFAYDSHFVDLDEKYGDDLSAGQPKSNAERIFYAIASPEEIAEFQKQMEGFQQPIDQLYADKADDVARTLQYNKDMLQYNKELKAASNQLNEDFSNLGLDKFTLAQLNFKQGGDGSIQVSGHPQANEIADAINGDAHFAELVSFAFGFSGSNSVTA